MNRNQEHRTAPQEPHGGTDIGPRLRGAPAAGLASLQRAGRVTLATLVAGTAIAVASGAATPTPAAASTGPGPGNVYDIWAHDTTQMTVQDQSTADGALVVTQPPMGNLSRSWRLVDTGAGGGFYQLRNAASGLCLEIAGTVAPVNTPAQQYRCDPNFKNQPNQLWRAIPKEGGGFAIMNKASGLKLYRTEQGSVLQSRSETPWFFRFSTDVYLLCTDKRFAGTCMGRLDGAGSPFSYAELSQTGIEGRSIYSIWRPYSISMPLDSGVALFSAGGFGGSCKHFWTTDDDLSDDPGLTSLADLPKPRSAVLGKGCPAGVSVCLDPGFNGCLDRSTKNGYYYMLDQTNDAVSSVYAKPGVTFALYSDSNGEGTCETFTGSDPDLRNNAIGDNRLTGFIIGHRCEQDVQLCEHIDLGGRCVSFRSHKPSLRATDIGNDTASSVRVPEGWQISVFSDDQYRGLVDVFNGPKTVNFGPGSTVMPNDSASSLVIRAWPSTTPATCTSFGCLTGL